MADRVRYLAFLRAINVGGHTVKMDRLRELFAEIGFADVETFIASGNVIFTTDTRATAATLERRIEQHLQAGLGYTVTTFLRTDLQVRTIARREPFAEITPADGDTTYVAFLRKKLTTAQRRAVSELSNDRDLLAVIGRELHWLSRGSMADATIDAKLLEKAMGAQPTTVRNRNTVVRLAKKLAPGV